MVSLFFVFKTKLLGSYLNMTRELAAALELSERFAHSSSEKQCSLCFLPPAVSCGVPVLPENGGIDGSAFTYGNKVTYR